MSNHNISSVPSSSFDITNVQPFVPRISSYCFMGLNIDNFSIFPKNDEFIVTIIYHFEFIDKNNNKHHTYPRRSHIWKLKKIETYLFLTSLIYKSRVWRLYYNLHQIYNTDLSEFWDIDNNYVAKNSKIKLTFLSFDDYGIVSDNNRGLGSFMLWIHQQYQVYRRSYLINPDDIPEEWKQWIIDNMDIEASSC